MTMNMIMTPAKAGCVVYVEMEPDAHPPHCQPLQLEDGQQRSLDDSMRTEKEGLENKFTHH
jgi:hypothetical protein